MKRLIAILVVLAALVGGGIYMLWPRASQGLVLYSALDYGPAVAKAFTKETGMPVTVIDISTGALLAKISAEGHRPAWSVAWFDGDLAAAALDKAGLLDKHTVPNLPWTKLGRSLIPADGSYTPTGLTLAGAFSYHRGSLANPPTHWTDLLAPAYRGVVGMNNPSISGPTYPILAGMLSQAGGWPKGKDYVLALKANGLHVYPKNSNTLAALRSNAIKVSITQSSAAWYVAAQDPSLTVQIPDPSYALPSVITVAPGLSPAQKATALRFIRFVMSPKVQALRKAVGEGDGYYWPLTSDVQPKKTMPPLSSLSVIHLPAADWGPRESRINSWFSKTVLGK